jgi:hypothetical protein
MSSRIEVRTIFFETNIMSDLSHSLCEYDGACQIAIYFHSFEIFIIQIGEIAFCKPELLSSQIICRFLKKANASKSSEKIRTSA